MLNMRSSELRPHADSTGKVFLKTTRVMALPPASLIALAKAPTRFPVRLGIGTGGRLLTADRGVWPTGFSRARPSGNVMEWALSDADTRRHNAEHSCEVERSETKAPPPDQAPADMGGSRRGRNRRFPGLLPVGEQSTWPVREEPRKRPSAVGRSKTRALQLGPAHVRSAHAGHCQVG